MKIVHLSYARVRNVKDPESWLKQISFFTGVLSRMAEKHEVFSTHGIDYSGTLQHNGVIYRFFSPVWLGRIFHLEIHTWVKNIKPDVVIVHGLHFPWYILCLRLLVGRNVRIFVQHHAEHPSGILKGLLQHFADNFVDGYFFSSIEISERWVRMGRIRDKSKVHEVMEVSSVFQPRQGEIIERDPMDDRTTYLWVGRLDKNKDPVTLLNAFTSFLRQNTTVELLMVFKTSDLLSEVRTIAEKYPGRIHLLGELPHEEMRAIYDRAHFIISTSHYEGSGVAVCEAMSRGCIPILSAIPSFRMMTNNGAIGILFPTGDSKSLHKSLQRSLSLDRTLEMQRVLSQYRAKLSFEAIAEKITHVISN